MLDFTELGQVLESFNQSKRALEGLIGVDRLAELEQLAQRARDGEVVIAAFGETNSGKSSLLNALSGTDHFSASEKINQWNEEIEAQNSYQWVPLEGFKVVLRDTPGIAGDFRSHHRKAKSIADSADVILYVVWNAVKGDEQVQALKTLLSTGKPVLIVLNKADITKEKERTATRDDILSKFAGIIDGSQFISCSASPMHGAPDVDELASRIQVIVSAERAGLIKRTLESVMEAAVEQGSEEMARRQREREDQLEREVRRQSVEVSMAIDGAKREISFYSKIAAGIAAVVPFGLDALTSAGAVLKMLHSIAKCHNVTFDGATLGTMAKELVQAFIGILFTSAATLAAYKALTVGAKTNPFTYAVGMALDGAVTYFIVSGIGNAFSYYCANRMTWGAKGSAAAFLKEWISENIDTFLDKLPKKMRAKAMETINKDLLK